MIYIDPFSPPILKAKKIHLESLFPLVKERLNNLGENDELRDFLNDFRINRILTDLPEFLESHHIDLLNQLDGYSIEDWAEYIKVKKKKVNRTPEETAVFNKYRALVKKVLGIFKYDSGFARKKKRKYCAYDLAKSLNIQTCVYCNRLYTKTVKKPKKTIRPEFDHWFPKENYPILALSFYNLIPSCHICNSNVKGTIAMNLNDFIHPYIDNNIDFKFSYWIRKYDKYNFKINRIIGSKEDRTIKAFKLEEIYKTHRDEINDLVKIKKLYSINYLLKLKKTIDKTGQKTSLEELYRLAFGVITMNAIFIKDHLAE